MKILIHVTLIPLLLSGINLPYFIPDINPEKIAQAQPTRTNQQALEVALSQTIIVYRKQGGSLSGELTGFNSQNLIIAARGTSQNIPIVQIRQVKFQGDVWDTIENSLTPRMSRGSINNSQPQEKTWSGIPISAFTLQQNAKKASLKLGTVLKPEDWQDILDISKESVYVLDDISFDASAKTMTIKALVVDRKKL